MCALAWYGRRILAAVRLFCRSCAQAGMFLRVPLPLPTAVRPPHRTENEACCVWKNAAVKQPPVSSLAFKAERFIPAVKTPLWFQPLVCTSPYSSLAWKRNTSRYSLITAHTHSVCLPAYASNNCLRSAGISYTKRMQFNANLSTTCFGTWVYGFSLSDFWVCVYIGMLIPLKLR